MTITDPNGLITLALYEKDAANVWNLVNQEDQEEDLIYDLGGYGELMILDPANLKIIIDSDDFVRPFAHDYYGDYEI